MKKLIVFALAAFLLTPAYSAGKKFGAGFRLGAPTGFDFKYWLNGKNSLNFVLGWGSSYLGDRYGYNDDRCYSPGFYDNNRGFCDGIRFNYYSRYGQYGYSNFHLHLDYILHNFSVIKASFPLPLYYGFGVQYEYLRYYDAWLAARGTIGLDFLPRGVPFDFFVEVTPLFWFLPAPVFDVYGGVGARFWF